MKKGSLFTNSWLIITFIMALMFGTFTFIFYDQVWEEYLIEPLDNVSRNTISELNLNGTAFNPNQVIDHIKTSYDSRDLAYDLIFVFLFLVAFISTSYSAAQSRKLGVMSYFGYLFIFSMGFLLVLFFIAQFTDYFISNIFIPIFSDATIDTPIFIWFFNNINIVAFIWFIWLGLLNQFDIKGFIKSKVDDFDIGGFQR